MLIANSVVWDTSKGMLYKQIKPPLMGEHALPLTVFFCCLARATFGGRSGIMSTAKQELHYPCDSQAKSRDETRLLRGGK